MLMVTPWLVAATILVALSACGQAQSESSNAHAGRPAATEIRLSLWTLALSPWFDDYMKAQIAAFEADQRERLHQHVVVDWVDVFIRKAYKDIIIESVDYCQKEKGLRVYAYVIMSSHLHLIVEATKPEEAIKKWLF